jgi:hypothetical protein
MADITKDPAREIIEDFRKEIERCAVPTAKPSFDVIHFRAESQRNFERRIMDVPIDRLPEIMMCHEALKTGCRGI